MAPTDPIPATEPDPSANLTPAVPWQDLIDHLGGAVVVYDAADRLLLSNEEFRRLYATLADHLVPGRSFEEGLRAAVASGLVPQSGGREQEWIDERLRAHAHPAGPLLRQFADGRWRRIVETRLADGSLLSFSVDVTEQVRSEQELVDLKARLDDAHARLEQLSESDALTGIANRRLFDRRLADEWSRVARHGSTLTLILADVDHFGRYNDRHGRPAGDECLRQVVKVLAGFARRPTDLVARFGGAEFALLLPHAEVAAAARLAMRLVSALDEARIPHGDSPLGRYVTLSVGVARVSSGPPGGQDALVQAAERALQRAKSAGRHRAEFA